MATKDEVKSIRAAKRARYKANKAERLINYWRNYCSSLPQPTAHALERWAERIPAEYEFWHSYHHSRVISWDELVGPVRAAGLVLRLRPTSEFRFHDKSKSVFVIDSGSGVKALKTVVRLDLAKI